jgi:hypothetical protein
MGKSEESLRFPEQQSKKDLRDYQAQWASFTEMKTEAPKD